MGEADDVCVDDLHSFGYLGFLMNELKQSKNDLNGLNVRQHFGTYNKEHMANVDRMHHSLTREYDKFNQEMDENDAEASRMLELIGFVKEYSSQRLKDTYYPKDVAWKRTVVEKG